MALLLITSGSFAKGVYQKPEEFIRNAFNQETPEPDIIWIRGELRQDIENILQHKYKAKRIRYWKNQQRSVWILEEIGKKKPITVGIVIDNNKINQLKVLVFRETRGWEVRYPFFSKQFNQLSLINKNELSDSVDGISGATLSVRALTKLARIALLLNQQILLTESIK
jgi:FMN-binding domain